ncbi:hypothetical protein LEMLEM_LOCUS6724 [Lemmus lemmus]
MLALRYCPSAHAYCHSHHHDLQELRL